MTRPPQRDLETRPLFDRGKDGTGADPQPGGGYYTDRYLHSFFGYFPAHEPRFIIFLSQSNRMVKNLPLLRSRSRSSPLRNTHQLLRSTGSLNCALKLYTEVSCYPLNNPIF